MIILDTKVASDWTIIVTDLKKPDSASLLPGNYGNCAFKASKLGMVRLDSCVALYINTCLQKPHTSLHRLSSLTDPFLLVRTFPE